MTWGDSLVLGLDGGGTKSVLAFADRRGRVAVLRNAESLDPTRNPDWSSALTTLLAREAPAVARTEAAVLGLPFHDEIADHTDAQTRLAQTLIAAPTVVENDVRIAFDGALAGASGVLVLAGTGSMAWASLNGPDDPHIRVGGWGDAFGDEGSAYWIGRETLALVSRGLDGRAPRDGFATAVLEALGVPPDGLLDWCYGLVNRRSGIARVAQITSRLAEAGEPRATAILETAGEALAEQARVAWTRTGASDPLTWSYAGGVLTNRVVLDTLRWRMGRDPTAPVLPPIGGALLRAAITAGWSVDPTWIGTLGATLASSGTRPLKGGPQYDKNVPDGDHGGGGSCPDRTGPGR